MTTPKIYSYTRFSNPQQEKGHSLERQMEAILNRINEDKRFQGMEIDRSLELTDRGMSGFHGTHIEKGALGKFLELIKNGVIAKGSVLIIENIDRFSRLEPKKALKLFDLVVDNGIIIATSNIIYDDQTINKPEGYILLGELQRAHNESKLKSQRVKAAWDRKFQKAIESKEIITNQYPSWLIKAEDERRFEFKPNAKETIEQIFKWKRDGIYGVEATIRELKKMPNIWEPKAREMKSKPGVFVGGGWRKSFINKLLHGDRRLIGEFQPCYRINGKSKIAEDLSPIKDYFPSIDAQLFLEVQARIREANKEKGHYGGRSDLMNNLFVHIVKCGYCGSSIHYLGDGWKKKNGYRYLHCDLSRRNAKKNDGTTCFAKPIRYDDFERVFFDNIYEFDVKKILPPETKNEKELQQLRRQELAEKEKLKNIQKKLNNIRDYITDNYRDTSISKRDWASKSEKTLEKEDVECLKIRKNILKRKKELESLEPDLEKNFRRIKDIWELLGNSEDESDIIKIRHRINNEIKRVVRSIDITSFHDKGIEKNIIEKKLLNVKKKYLEAKKQSPKDRKIKAIRRQIKSLNSNLNEIKEDIYNEQIGRIYGGKIEVTFNVKSTDVNSCRLHLTNRDQLKYYKQDILGDMAIQ